MKKCFNCNSDMIYLGKHGISPLSFALGETYNYICPSCGQIEWATLKEKSKYKWYKYPKEELKKLIKLYGYLDKEEVKND